jgi:hypothetical protein
MNWFRREKKLAIGVISVKSLKNNPRMVFNEYDRIIDEKKKEVDTLNKMIINGIESMVINYIKYPYNLNYYSRVKLNRDHLTDEKSIQKFNEIMKKLKLEKSLLDTSKELDFIRKLEDERNMIAKKYGLWYE